MRMVRANIDCQQTIATMLADLSDGSFYHGAHDVVQGRGWLFELFSLGLLPTTIRGDARRAISVMFAPIHCPALIAMQPRSVATKCDQIGKRKFTIIPIQIIHRVPPMAVAQP